MSEMEVWIGTFEENTGDLIVPDEYEGYWPYEKENNRVVVDIGNVQYICTPVYNGDTSGYMFIVKSERPLIAVSWYNGGASVSEVLEDCIRGYLKDQFIEIA